MADFMMIMKGQTSKADSAEQWGVYIQSLVDSGKFRGGSAFGNSRCLSVANQSANCVATGFMRFEADSIEEIEALVAGNPVVKAGGEVELHELVVS